REEERSHGLRAHRGGVARHRPAAGAHRRRGGARAQVGRGGRGRAPRRAGAGRARRARGSAARGRHRPARGREGGEARGGGAGTRRGADIEAFRAARRGGSGGGRSAARAHRGRGAARPQGRGRGRSEDACGRGRAAARRGAGRPRARVAGACQGRGAPAQPVGAALAGAARRGERGAAVPPARRLCRLAPARDAGRGSDPGRNRTPQAASGAAPRKPGSEPELVKRVTQRSSTAALTVAALGIVFGDIGTSPLYAVKETFSPEHGIALSHESILGGVSTIFWALMIVVSLKYVLLIMRADNRGEGGIMALIALAASGVRERPGWRRPLMLIGIFGAALFYGDAVLTPAISVLSAVEGLHIGTTVFDSYVVPIAVAVLLALFAVQARGTAAVGRFFGPITMLWFVALAAAGIYGIVREPSILAALSPLHAFSFLTGHGAASFVVLGAVVLAVTGAEALYADMGHFGKGAVRIGWFSLVAPALVLNYFGQGALLMAQPQA